MNDTRRAPGASAVDSGSAAGGPGRAPSISWSTVVVRLVMIAGAVVMVLPIAWVLSASVQSRVEILSEPFNWIPASWRWSNYAEALEAAPFVRYFLNSVVIATASTAIHLAITSLAAFGFAFYSFPGKRLLFLAILSTMMIPFQVIMIPLYLQVRELGWINTYQGLILPTAVTALGVFLMRQFMQTIHRDYFDAARIDGASEFQLFYRVALPLSKSALSALAIFVFLEQWNSLLWPLIVVTDANLRPLAMGLSEFQTQYGTEYQYLLAASTASAIPIVLMFIVLRRQFVQGLAVGGSKG